MVVLIYGVVMCRMVRNADWNSFPQPTVQTIVNGDWAEEIEGYLGENFGYHDSLFRLKSQMDLLLGEKLIGDVYVTEDMLLEKLAADQMQDIPQSAAVLNAFYEKYHIPTYFVLIPSASEIYEDLLPANVVKENQQALIRETYAGVETGVRCVDAYHILSSLTDEYVYYRTDTRWTSYGAYCVYQSAIQKMGMTAVPYNRYVISHMSTNFRGNLYERTLYEDVKSDVLDCYSYENGAAITSVIAHYADGMTEDRGTQLYDLSKLRTDDMYDFYLGDPCAMLCIQTDLDNDRRLLVYKDDFADCFIPFLLQHYSEICVVDIEESIEVSERLSDPTDFSHVLFLCSMESWCNIWSQTEQQVIQTE